MRINGLKNGYIIQSIKCKDNMSEFPKKENSQKENRKKQKEKNSECDFNDVLKYHFDIRV